MQSENKRTITLLLADDHTVVRESLALLLATHEGFKVIGTAADGHEAVKESERLHPDVVVMDISMPRLNGIEATSRLRKASPRTKVLILSMHDSSEHIYRALDAGARGYLLKESAATELVSAIRAVHAGRRYFGQKVTESVVDQYVREHKATSPLESLSQREREILQLIVEGRTSAEVADELALSTKTVETYRSRLMHKLGIGDIPSLVKFAIQHGIISLR